MRAMAERLIVNEFEIWLELERLMTEFMISRFPVSEVLNVRHVCLG